MATEFDAPDGRPGQADPSPSAPEVAQVTPAEVEQCLGDLAAHIRFRVVVERDGVVVRVLDPSTDRVVRQIPAPALLEVRRRLERSLRHLAGGAR